MPTLKRNDLPYWTFGTTNRSAPRTTSANDVKNVTNPAIKNRRDWISSRFNSDPCIPNLLVLRHPHGIHRAALDAQGAARALLFVLEHHEPLRLAVRAGIGHLLKRDAVVQPCQFAYLLIGLDVRYGHDL